MPSITFGTPVPVQEKKGWKHFPKGTFFRMKSPVEQWRNILWLRTAEGMVTVLGGEFAYDSTSYTGALSPYVYEAVIEPFTVNPL